MIWNLEELQVDFPGTWDSHPWASGMKATSDGDGGEQQ